MQFCFDNISMFLEEFFLLIYLNDVNQTFIGQKVTEISTYIRNKNEVK